MGNLGLAWLYFEGGNGVKKDLIKAWVWANLAENQILPLSEEGDEKQGKMTGEDLYNGLENIFSGKYGAALL